jgi:hypothetical protein
MKKSRWDKRYMIIFSDGQRIVATGAICDLMVVGFHEAAVRLYELGEKDQADLFQKKSNDIYSQLNSFGFYDGIMEELLK